MEGPFGLAWILASLLIVQGLSLVRSNNSPVDENDANDLLVCNVCYLSRIIEIILAHAC